MNFEYFYQRQALGNLEIDDIGNCAIEANTDEGEYFYLVTETNYGQTTLFTYGPIVLDLPLLPSAVTCQFNRFEFKVPKIATIITKFLAPRGYQITQAKEIDKKEAFKNCINIIDYMATSKEFK